MTPTIVELPDRPYVGLAGTVTMSTIGRIADKLPSVFAWLGARGIEPAGAPFFKYNVIDMDADLELEVGVSVAHVVESDGEIMAGVLPGGRYATVTHVGHPDGFVWGDFRVVAVGGGRGVAVGWGWAAVWVPAGGVPDRSRDSARYGQMGDRASVPAC
jgi:hypothetical protein